MPNCRVQWRAVTLGDIRRPEQFAAESTLAASKPDFIRAATDGKARAPYWGRHPDRGHISLSLANPETLLFDSCSCIPLALSREANSCTCHPPAEDDERFLTRQTVGDERLCLARRRHCDSARWLVPGSDGVATASLVGQLRLDGVHLRSSYSPDRAGRAETRLRRRRPALAPVAARATPTG